jgi:hypothetical protein
VSRHDFDPTSLIAGLVFVVIGAVFSIAAVTDTELGTRWVWPALLIGLGLAGLAASLPRSRPRDDAGGTADLDAPR